MTQSQDPAADEPVIDNWKDQWEYTAHKTHDFIATMSEDEILAYIKEGKSDQFFQVWSVLAKKGTLPKSALVLWEYLKTHPGKDYELERYHCAEALFTLLGIPDPDCKNSLRQQVQWDHDGEKARQKALLELKEIILKKLERKK